MTKNDILVVMDSDGEDVPNTIPYLIEKLKGSEFQVAAAERKKDMKHIILNVLFFLQKFISHYDWKKIHLVILWL